MDRFLAVSLLSTVIHAGVFGPHLQPLATLYTGGSLADRQEAATKLLDLSETVWVAVLVLLLGAAIFSLILTKRVAGPLQILEHSIRQCAQGDLTGRVRFRKVDRLDHFAQSINSAVQTIEARSPTWRMSGLVPRRVWTVCLRYSKLSRELLEKSYKVSVRLRTPF